MKAIRSAILACAFMGLSGAVLAETVVIVHPSNNAALDEKSVQRIFLGKEKKFSDGGESIPVNQVPESAVRADFDTNILGRSSSQVSAYWSKLVFTGKGVPPKEVSSDAEVIELVAKNPSAIGYIDSASLTDAVKSVNLN
ncbi:phosphate ABC transporter substrate-binding protein [Alteromonas facilis]|uniref:phosphate ABC transporter substrate-binding protein n=1 Tax=Alteromonas facilis TaxID=2048004 RepID=UPI001F0C7C60|nr:phosphate ABC transporter substrate-binding protein [Alteromonas facilis]